MGAPVSDASGAGIPLTDRAKRIFVKSFGCQMNVYDSHRMADVAAQEGYQEAATIEDADLVVLNTCHIRERASEKIYSELGKVRELREAREVAGLKTTIVVAGCVAQAEGAEILRRQPAVDLVVGPQNYHRLPQLLRAASLRSGVVDTTFPVEDKFDHLPASSPATIRSRGVSAFVTVQEGCDKFCSFCVVPYTRGAESSRSVAKVVQEIVGLARAGVREVTLIGQNVNAYHGQDEGGRAADLAHLLNVVAKIPGILRVRYTTSHPNDMSEALILAHRDNPSLAPYLHLPVQSGSNRILAAMNRKHDVGDYMDIVGRIRAVRPDIALSSDFIVGYPGESDADFQETLDLVGAVGFAASYTFKYSSRPGTPGAELKNQIDEQTKSARLLTLQQLLEDQRQAFNRAAVGRIMPVLFEKSGRHAGQVIGRSPYLQSVYAVGDAALIGAIADVEIIGVGPNSLRGRIVAPASQSLDEIQRNAAFSGEADASLRKENA
ncbi:tRNA (N6-isopentenyl adenosine(37)-C2)-methylthiotransferase MiaB [Methylocapsa sp. S129]|uniref:tRNA (N6-isopentenyl adenosine(37)-C2)-methylthiotransferase MiaB n=1 Tax=Methylocapsa sp. S129 TaxID=1641869 RepID=UPI00352A01E2